jgi:hypothetical protein
MPTYLAGRWMKEPRNEREARTPSGHVRLRERLRHDPGRRDPAGRVLSKSVKSSRKYTQITASIREIGIGRAAGGCAQQRRRWQLVAARRTCPDRSPEGLGQEQVECLVSTDDEAFTYNKRISRLAPIQEHRMILKAIERGVSEEKIAPHWTSTRAASGARSSCSTASAQKPSRS